eukprot:m.91250 g.91250  ORF g.91250 m.91250 type:complete len:309 (-) comp8866_c0_seq2:2331-3257(-)
MIQVFKSSFKVRYLAPLCSRIIFVSLILALATIIFPLIVSMRSGGFLLDNEIGREEPLVFFNREVVLLVIGSSGAPLAVWSTIAELNSALGDLLRFPTMKVSELDANFDGRPESLSLNLSLPLPPNEFVSEVTILAGFNCQFRDFVRMNMSALAYISASTTTKSNGLFVSGDLTFVQKSVLPAFGNRNQYSASLLRPERFSPSSFDLDAILREYSKRNESFKLTSTYALWKRPAILSKPFEIAININYIEAEIRYIPGLAQQLKHIWIQYLALLIPFMWVATSILGSIVRNGSLPVFIKPDKIKSHSS